MYRWSGTIHGFLRINHHRILFVFHFDLMKSSGGSHFIFCHHCCNVISIITYTSCKKIAVCNILMSQFYRPGMPRRGITVIRNVFKGDHFYNALHGFCFAGIYGCNDSVSNFCVKNLCYQTVGRSKIIRKFCSSCYFLISIYSGNAFSYHILTCFL